MRAQINNPGWVKALEDYVEILRYAPPGAKDFDIVDVRTSFVNREETAMALDWGDTGQIAADPSTSALAGKVGYFVLPGSERVWNYRKESWEVFPQPHKAPFLAFGGWIASVPKTSKHRAAAWDFISWYSSPENSLKDVVTSGSGINPYRFTHFLNIDEWTHAFSRRAAAEYLGCLLLAKNQSEAVGCIGLLDLGNGICEMRRLYVRPQYRKSGIGKALAKAAIEQGRKMGYTSMRLNTNKKMTGAEELYRSLGFKNIEPYEYFEIDCMVFLELKLI